MKTNAVRYLESAGVAFETRDYEVDPEDLPTLSTVTPPTRSAVTPPAAPP
jgi:hypothetical protein